MNATKKKRVVVQYPFIPHYRIPVFAELAGSDKYDVRYWAGRAASDPFLKSALDGTGLPVEEVPLWEVRVPLLGKTLEFQWWSIPKLIRRRPDVFIILANPYSVTAWISMATARIAGSIVLAWSHGFLEREDGAKGLVRAAFYSIAHGHFLYGSRARELMAEKGFDLTRLHVVFNSLNYEEQSVRREGLSYADRVAMRGRLAFPERCIVLLSIGRLVPKLRVDEAIEVIEKCGVWGRDVRLIIVGDGPERRRLESLAREKNLGGRVRFVGAIHDERELAPLFNAVDYSIAMGSVGLSAMHSLGYGIPMVINDEVEMHGPEIEAVREGETGYWFRAGDLKDCISKIRDIPYRGTVFRNCIETIEKCYTPKRQKEFIERAVDYHLNESRSQVACLPR